MPYAFCVDGVTAGDNFVVAEEGGTVTTCASMVAYALAFKGASADCAGLQGLEFLFCPTPVDNPCRVCAGGITAGDDFVVSEEGDHVTTCADVVVYAAFFEATSATCAGIQAIELACCPPPADYLAPSARMASPPGRNLFFRTTAKTRPRA